MPKDAIMRFNSAVTVTAFLSLLLLQPLAWADSGTDGGLNVLSFSMNPSVFLAGAEPEFSFRLECNGNSVVYYQAQVRITDSYGRQAGAMDFRPGTIAGGEKITQTMAYASSGLGAGDYKAHLSVIYSGGNATSLAPIAFTVLAPKSLPSGEGGQGAAPLPQGGASESLPVSCGPEVSCGEWSGCADGYRSRFCSHVPACSQPDFYRVEACNRRQPNPLEAGICRSAPFFCTTDSAENQFLPICLPPIAVMLFSLAFLTVRYFYSRRYDF